MKVIKNNFIYLMALLAPFTVMSQAKLAVKNKRQAINSRGEFSYRMDLAIKRLTGSSISPVFTDKFVLADVNFDMSDPRRFYNFSGDLSGRFVEVMTLVSKDNPAINIKPLVHQLISYQKKDGRFGNDTLVYTTSKIGPEHMAQIWGNGRLLVGLMEYYNNYKDPAVLKSAHRLGDFLLNTYQACADPGVIKRLDGLGATGIICLTQYIEGLVALSKATNDPKYAAVAEKIYPVLPERGVQHTHGYLTTLRGVLYLYEYDHKEAQLDYVKKAYADLVHSKDYNVFGSVNEYFGPKGERDEGCATADFVRLSLELYKISGESTYLEKGEFALLNAMYFNQYYTGDFGHHLINAAGSRPDYLHTAWWCCTMHGLRAMYEIRDRFLVTTNKGSRKLNLYLETNYKDTNSNISISKNGYKNGMHEYKIVVNKWLDNDSLSLRIPEWAEATTLKLNSKSIAIKPGSQYADLKRIVKQGDVITIAFKYAVRVRAHNELMALNTINTNVKGNLIYGPYLLGVDDKVDPTFTSEPSDNTIYKKTIENGAAIMPGTDSYLTAFYKHGGYPSYARTIIRPVSEMTFDKHGYMLCNFLFAPDDTHAYKQDNSMTEPWKAN